MITLEGLHAVLAEIKYRDWRFVVRSCGEGFLLQVEFTDHAGDVWRGRKLYVSPHSTRSEVVQTALLAVLIAEEHEAREQFQYRGEAIFAPHFHSDALLQLSLSGPGVFDKRAEGVNA
jgi:hypothetical protein